MSRQLANPGDAAGRLRKKNRRRQFETLESRVMLAGDLLQSIEIDPEELLAAQVASDQVSSDQIASDQVASDQVSSNQVASDLRVAEAAPEGENFTGPTAAAADDFFLQEAASEDLFSAPEPPGLSQLALDQALFETSDQAPAAPAEETSAPAADQAQTIPSASSAVPYTWPATDQQAVLTEPSSIVFPGESPAVSSSNTDQSTNPIRGPPAASAAQNNLISSSSLVQGNSSPVAAQTLAAQINSPAPAPAEMPTGDVTDLAGGMAVAASSSLEGEAIVVNTTADENDGIDAGAISLRDAVSHAATHTEPVEILFADSLADQTITLSSALGPITLNDDLVIDGEGNNISVSGGDATSIFKITGGDVTIRNLTLRDGLARGGHGEHSGRDNDNGGGGGGAGMGGAVAIENGNVAIDSVTFIDNQAIGGNGGNSSTPQGG
ncbi:MAG: LEPR-XLL domain-containing protein, partial [Pirellulales bacterium]|nr:LEPR-XLL domain-containing protein [Pirellulales bacterium]